MTRREGGGDGMGERVWCRQLGADGGWSANYWWGEVELERKAAIRLRRTCPAQEGGRV